MKNKSKNDVLALIHDINSPLCALRGLLKEESRDNELERVAYKRFIELSNKLKNHFYQEAPDTFYSFLDTIEEAVDLKEVEHPKVIFSIQSQSYLRDLVFNFSQMDLERCLSNLINNAVEAGASQICIKLIKQKDKLLLKVVDNGNGFFAQDISYVHRRPGYSTKDSGSGIGLSSGIDFLKKVGGELKILSTPYIGSNIILSFPQELFDSVDYGPFAG